MGLPASASSERERSGDGHVACLTVPENRQGLNSGVCDRIGHSPPRASQEKSAISHIQQLSDLRDFGALCPESCRRSSARALLAFRDHLVRKRLVTSLVRWSNVCFYPHALSLFNRTIEVAWDEFGQREIRDGEGVGSLRSHVGVSFGFQPGHFDGSFRDRLDAANEVGFVETHHVEGIATGPKRDAFIQ
jgi:hypothetical protein